MIQGDILKELRRDKQLTQKDIAKILGISGPLYSMYETGARPMRIEMLCRIADVLDTSTDYILGRTDDPSPYHQRKKKNKKY